MFTKRGLLRATLGLTAVAFFVLGLQAAQEGRPQPKSNTQDFSQAELAAKEKVLAEKFKEFETLMLILKQRLERSTSKEDNELAKRLGQALDFCARHGIRDGFGQLVEFLGKNKLGNTRDVQDVIRISGKLAEHLKELLDVLRNRTSTADRKEERKSLEKLLAELEKVIRQQRIINARIEDKDRDPKEVAQNQGDVRKDTRELARGFDKDGKGEKGDGSGSEAKNTQANSKEGKGQGAKGEGKNKGKPGEAQQGKGKNEGKGGEGQQGKGKTDGDKGGEKQPGKQGDQGGAKGQQGGEKQAGGAKGGDKGGDKSSGGKGQGGDKAQAGGAKGGQGGEKGGEKEAGKGKDDGSKVRTKPEEKQGGAKGQQGGEKQAGGSKGGQKGGEKSSQSKGGQQAGDKQGDAKSSQQSGQGGAKSSGSKGGGQPMPGGEQGGDQGGAKDDGQKGGQKGGQKPSDGAQDAKKRIQDAEQHMRKAQDKVAQNQRKPAAEEGEKALDELAKAKKKLEDLLRQLREEELERLLTELKSRCEKMLAMQIAVLNGTTGVDRAIAANADKKPTRANIQDSFGLSDEEKKIINEASQAITLLEAEGSAVAFHEAFTQVREDMKHVQRRLGVTDVGKVTQAIEQDIIDTLKEMIKALEKKQQEMKDQKPPKDGDSQPKPQADQKLLDEIAELKMIRAMQMRVNKRTELYGREYEGEQAEVPAIQRELRELSDRQDRIHGATRKIYEKANR